MATLALPARTDLTFYDFQVQLEEDWYRLELRWNARWEIWNLTIYDGSENRLSAGRAVVIGAKLQGRSIDTRLPPGIAWVVDTTGAHLDAGKEELGGRVALLYTESIDL